MSHRAEKTRSFLATSPVKYLSSFLSSSHSDLATLSKHQRAPSDDPSVLPATLSRNNSSRDTNSLYGSARSREGIRMGPEEERPENPLVRLEQTFTGYVASLQARKGNVSGRALLHRSVVDELSVNDLYNRLIENPLDIEGSYDLTADVVFAAFEKFVRIAWREQMGPIMTIKALDALQARAAKRVPGEFADFVNFLFADMAPQNRRAFTALIKLLADLLDGCGNDGDRGALTLAFAELLVDDSSAHNYINLLDKLVEDCDRIFDDGQGSFSASVGPGSSFESMTSTIRSGKSHTGSMTSNTSSLRRKLGFDTLLRQNSKTDVDPRPSVWRTLSKQGRHAAVADLTIGRARSIDAGSTKFRRPGSRDRPPIAGAFDDCSRPTSSHRLETIGEPESEEPVPQSPPRKRRSSLSDLKNLLEATHLEDDEDIDDDDGNGPPLQPLSRMRETSQKFNSGPGVPSPSRIPLSPKMGTGSLRSPRPKDAEVAFTDPFRAAAAAQRAREDAVIIHDPNAESVAQRRRRAARVPVPAHVESDQGIVARKAAAAVTAEGARTVAGGEEGGRGRGREPADGAIKDRGGHGQGERDAAAEPDGRPTEAGAQRGGAGGAAAGGGGAPGGAAGGSAARRRGHAARDGVQVPRR